MPRVRLKDICEVSWGDTTKTKASYMPEGYPAYSASGCDGFLPYFDHEGPGVVLSAIGAQCGKTWFAQGRWSCIKNTIYIKTAAPNADPRFIFYATSDPDMWPKRGAAQPFISQTDAQNVEIELPPLAMQRRIASILSAYDELMENCERRIRVLEQTARVLYREWFVEFRFFCHEKVPRIDSALGPIPKSWEVRTLNEVVDDIVDYRGKTPAKLDGNWSNEGVLALSALNVKGGRLVNLEKSRRVNEELYSRWMKNPLRSGDILMTSEAPLGELFFCWKQQRFCLSQRLFSLRANSRIIAPIILYLFMESEQTQQELRSRASGATVSGIRQSELRNVPVLVPPRSVQGRAEPILRKLADLKGTLDESLAKLRDMRDLLLPRLLSGQVALDVSAIEEVAA